jgi:hypothetical protein
MEFDNAVDQSQANARTLFVLIQLLEKAKDVLVIGWLNPDAVVLNKKDRAPLLLPEAHLDPGFGLAAHKLDGVADKVLHDF